MTIAAHALGPLIGGVLPDGRVVVQAEAQMVVDQILARGLHLQMLKFFLEAKHSTDDFSVGPCQERYSFHQSRCQSHPEAMVAQFIVSGSKVPACLCVHQAWQNSLRKCLVAPFSGKQLSEEAWSCMIIANA